MRSNREFSGSLYIHLPWCVRKCPYCDFNSHQSPSTIPEQAYLQALLADLKIEKDHLQSAGFALNPLQSIFIGGGTPSLFSPEGIAQLLQSIEFPIAPRCEITLEANPGTLETARLKEFHQAGINRLSIGIQSFNDKHLRRLGRIHSASEGHRAIEMAHKAEVHSFNIDLMHALPQQTVAEAVADLQAAIQHNPQHISWYELTIEPNTVFGHRPPRGLPNETDALSIGQTGREILQKAGYQRYEISAYSQAKDVQCQHNLNYWRYGDYIGIGAGAHSKLTQIQGQKIQRTRKFRSPQTYMSQCLNPAPEHTIHTHPAVEYQEAITDLAIADEFLLGVLRLNEGICLQQWSKQTGLSGALLQAVSKDLLKWDALFVDGDRIVVTEKWRDRLDGVIENLCLGLHRDKRPSSAPTKPAEQILHLRPR